MDKTYVMIWNPVERLLWGIAISLLILGGLQYYRIGKKKEQFNEKLILYGFAALSICIGFSSIFVYISDFLVPGTYENYIFYGNYFAVNSDYELLMRISFIFQTIGFILFLFSFELGIKRTRYILTTTQIIFLILIIISPYNISVMYLIISWTISQFFVLIILLLITR